MPPFQIIFNPTSAAELARMPKELQLQILGEFRGLPQQVLHTDLDTFGKLERAGRTLHRFRVGDYRVYFERHELGVVVHRIHGLSWPPRIAGFSAQHSETPSGNR